MDCATVTAGGRRLRLSGLHPAYLQALDGTDADKGILAGAVADLPSGSLLLDVGANIGFTALTMAAQRPDCRLVAFEAVPSNADCLRRNIQANDIPNVDVVEAVVSDAPGIVMMTDNGPWSVALADGTVRCRAVVLDDYASPDARFVKIDVEGHEPNVLAGASRLLDASRPLMAIEFNAWALLLHHYDPLTFADALWSSCEIAAVYHAEEPHAVPSSAMGLLHMNLLEHGCVSDLLLRPRGALPDLPTMTEAPRAQRLRAELAAMHASTSWRITAGLRSVGRTLHGG